MKNRIISIFIFVLSAVVAFAGNPDRQGEAGAGELLFNPWAASAGLHTLNTSSISGVEAMRLNVAGIGRGFDKTSIYLSNTRLFVGSDLQLNAFGLVQKVKKNSAIGISLVAVDFGDINITTYDLPEGTGGTYSPSFYHLGVGYSYTYQNKIAVGVLFRTIVESLNDVSASAFAIDAGVSYVAGERDNFKLGVSLRNIGTPMNFGGEGLSFIGSNPVGESNYQLTFNHRPSSFELPSVLNIGVSYDFYVAQKSFIRAMGNFTSNAFSLDQLGIGAEFNFNRIFAARVAYKHELSADLLDDKNIYTGVAAGFSVQVPLKKGSKRRISLDYAFRTTSPFEGSHNFGVRLEM